MDPVWEAVATALAGKAGEALAEGGRSAWDALVALVRTRLGHDTTNADGSPGDGTTVESLARDLADAERDDPDFGRRLRALWKQVGDVEARSEGTVNQVSGVVFGPLVQARDIRGGARVTMPSERRTNE
ncbi:hypothetical protein SAXI111661_10895 [Saccharomonospora xinjiangensis]|uniref:hypothetical protein n=1 Tax=Saccharomonospora xinjiangensis TaxID=75294 RepID=UPI00106FEA33|nr:hypothetical protein [Saccharomonospora xinjiangensis]QBQ60674.1 hypothetical protein EYD13_11605 [Saccharomonospora xinjiangensis]